MMKLFIKYVKCFQKTKYVHKIIYKEGNQKVSGTSICCCKSEAKEEFSNLGFTGV